MIYFWKWCFSLLLSETLSHVGFFQVRIICHPQKQEQVNNAGFLQGTLGCKSAVPEGHAGEKGNCFLSEMREKIYSCQRLLQGRG